MTMIAAKAPLLEVKGLNVRYPGSGLFNAQGFHAVREVSFALERGEIYALIGESGSGKTSLLRAMAGLIAATGSARLDGVEMIGRRARDLRALRGQIGFMFQDPIGSLPPRMTVGDLITEPFVIHGRACARAEKAAELLEMVQLPADFAHRFPSQLSGGQARRVGVARALALSPKVIFADEPTAGLDVSIQGELLNLLRDLQERLGLSIFIITHNLHVVRHIADRIAIMSEGRIVEEGANADVFERPQTEFTRTLLAANLQI